MASSKPYDIVSFNPVTEVALSKNWQISAPLVPWTLPIYHVHGFWSSPWQAELCQGFLCVAFLPCAMETRLATQSGNPEEGA